MADPIVGYEIDAVETCNANPTEVLNNHFTRWVNRKHLQRPEVGGTDSHFFSAIGRAGTLFPGTTVNDLLLAIRNGSTRPVGSVDGPLALLEFLFNRHAWKNFCQEDPIRSHFHH